MKRTFVALFLISLVSVNGFAYGNRGHQLVGAIADKRFKRGKAFEKNHGPGGQFYAIWAASVVKTEIQKGGWRLAALLEAVL